MTAAGTRKAVLVLALAQATAMTCNAIMILTSALAGDMLAEDKRWATLPLGLQFLATMATTFPASYLMKRYGRRAGFTVGALIGVVGGLVMAESVRRFSFPMFVLGNAIFGVSAAFTLFYRFAAAEASDEAFRPKAISLVMAGGIAAAIFGRPLATWGHDLIAPHLFLGGFLFVVILSVVVVLIILPLAMPRIETQGAAAIAAEALPARPILEIVRQPRAIAAIAAAMLGYGVMSFVMTATPLAMQFCGFELKTGIAAVIQWHVLGMFAPSFVTGHIIKRIGEARVMGIGLVLYVACLATAFAGVDINNFWFALIMLGLGWNFLYIAGTSELTKCYRPSERAKAQAFNDCATFSAVAVCSLTAGAVEQTLGWDGVLWGATLPVSLIALALIYGYRHRPVAPLQAS
jgi:MFS family permease